MIGARQARERYADCAKAMNLVDTSSDGWKASESLMNELHSLNEDLEVPTLREFGIERREFMQKTKLMAEQALDSGSPDNNPRVPSQEDIELLYQNIYDGKL